MAVSSSLLHDWTLQFQVTLDATSTKVKVLVDDFNQVFIGHTFLGSTVGVNVNRQWVWYTNSVRQLYQNTLGQASSYNRLGNPTGSVSSGTINLSGILTGESSTTVGTPATIGINNNLRPVKPASP